MSPWRSSVLVAASLISMACASQKPPADDPWNGYGSAPTPPTPPTPTCTVTGKFGILSYRAEVRGRHSQARRGLIATSARLEGNTVFYEQGTIRSEAGFVGATSARFTWLLHDSESEPIVHGATRLQIGFGALQVTSRGCSTRDVAFGALHLAAMIAVQQAQG